MSKYALLWEYVGRRADAKFNLTFSEIESITGCPWSTCF